MKIPSHYSELELAMLVGMTKSGLRGWRRRGYGPSWRKIGKSIYYEREAVEVFLASTNRGPNSLADI